MLGRPARGTAWFSTPRRGVDCILLARVRGGRLATESPRRWRPRPRLGVRRLYSSATRTPCVAQYCTKGARHEAMLSRHAAAPISARHARDVWFEGALTWRCGVAARPAVGDDSLEFPAIDGANLGVMRGSVCARAVASAPSPSLQTWWAQHHAYTELCEKRPRHASADAEHPRSRAHAFWGCAPTRTIAPGVTEVLAYGTAVVVEAQRG